MAFTRITGWRVGTHVKYEDIIRKEYYVNSKTLRGFGKNPKIYTTEEKALEFLNKIRKSTKNPDLFLDPVTAESEI